MLTLTNLQKFDDFKKPTQRLSTARAIAHQMGAEDLILFVKDPVANAFLPAPGFPQDFPEKKKWTSFLNQFSNDSNTSDTHEELLPSPENEKEIHVSGHLVSDSTLLAVLGAHSIVNIEPEMKVLFSLVGHNLENEMAKAASEQIEHQLLDEANSAIRARDELMSISSHEIKTPIAAMKLQVQIAKRRIDKSGIESLGDAQIIKLIEQADKQLSNLSRLIDDMLDFSRIHTGQFALELRPMNLSETVDEVIDRLSPHFAEMGCELTHSIERNVFIEGDPSRIEQAVINLLTNAAKYGCSQPVEVTLKTENGKAILKIRDHGPGIPKEDQDRVFKKFERAVTANGVSGLGLGLYIVRQIINCHKGSIRLESDCGQGATFITEFRLLK